MKESLSKYLIALAFLLIGTAILVSSRKVGNSTLNTKDNSNKASISYNLNTSDTLGVTNSSQTKDNLSPVQAEQVGSSPESGATSTAKQVYDFLVGKSDPDYGATQPSDWSFNFGTYWNRMLYSAFWEPDGTATESDVLQGKTFYSGSNNRVQKIGTGEYEIPSFYEEQSLIEYDDYETTDSSEDSALEESSWTNPATNVWKDTRTGLYWSNYLGDYTNIFPDQDHSTCDFFSTVPRGDYGTSGTDPDCGNAINACAVLELTSGGTSNTDWYLPSQKELKQAVRDGMYNQAGATFTTTGTYWSSTEYSSGSARAWTVTLHNGNAYYGTKGNGGATRCVRRD